MKHSEMTPQQQIKEILANFRFEKVHEMMEKMEWKWAMHDDLRVPTTGELYQAAERRLNYLISEPDAGYVESGGLRAIRHDDRFELLFNFESWSTQD